MKDNLQGWPNHALSLTYSSGQFAQSLDKIPENDRGRVFPLEAGLRASIHQGDTLTPSIALFST
jgi:hypothetical protein